MIHSRTYNHQNDTKYIFNGRDGNSKLYNKGTDKTALAQLNMHAKDTTIQSLADIHNWWPAYQKAELI